MTKPRMMIAGASGVVGRHLVAAARDHYEILVLTRELDGSEPRGTKPVAWKPNAAKENDEGHLERLADIMNGIQVLVNLAGASIANGRLDEAHKKRVLESRVESTTTLTEVFKRCAKKPEVWFQASAVGVYGNRGEEVLTESSSHQADFFLAKVVEAWEAAAQQVCNETRLVIGRFGLVLAKDAEAWQKLLMPIRLFAGGPLGSGRQWFAWIDADDLARAILLLIEQESAQGVYNFTTPEPVRQIDLTRKAARILGRPSILPAPAFALKLVLGEVADALLLPSARVMPERLEQAGFQFQHPDIDAELIRLLNGTS